MGEKMNYTNTNQKKPVMAVSLSDKVDFKVRNITKNKERDLIVTTVVLKCVLKQFDIPFSKSKDKFFSL